MLAPLIVASPAVAVPYELRYQGTYDDLLHPSCVREITVKPATRVNAKGKKVKGYAATFRGTDVGPPGIGDKIFLACDEDSIRKYGLREFEFGGKVEGTRIDAGDGIHQGDYNSMMEGDSFDGIRWKDGNRWLKTSDVIPPPEAPSI
ncbi:hypothetical protein TrRE_jg2863 [Triparma retinervis]|uniref:Uncharacterized protein n=1 Tax=Triparma retinervis TaxID=2557542 RepID=A0A9W7CE56_9STRA|nr:hypothetical protein TrRE_jg2863 [Triparma retinervis]